MELTIDRKQLLAMLDQAAKHVVTRTTIPVMRTVLLSATANRATVTAANFSVEFSAGAEAGVAAQGEAALDAEMLRTFVGQAPDGDIHIRLDEGFTKVRAGRTWCRIPALPAADFPRMAPYQPDVSFELDAKTLAGSLEAVSHAISKEATRFYLCGINWSVTELHLELCATTGHVLALVRLGLPEGAEAMPPVIVPEFPMPPMTGTVAVAVTPSLIRFSCGDTVVTSKLVDGTFPDYHRIIPKPVAVATVDRKALVAAVRRCGAIDEKQRRWIDLAHDTPGELVVRCPGTDGSMVEDAVSVDGSQFAVSLDHRYATATLASFDSEVVEIGLAEGGSSICFTIPGEAGRLCLVMPMRGEVAPRIGPPP